MRLFGHARLSLDRRLPLDAALDEAFAPLRARCANVGPARVRAAIRWAAPEPRPLHGLALLTRVSELTVAAAISAFLFAGVVASPTPAPAIPDLSRDSITADKWMLIGRGGFPRPIDSPFSAYRTTAGDMAANAATARRAEVVAPVPVVRDSEPFSSAP